VGRYCSVVPLTEAHATDLFAVCAGDGNDALWEHMSDGPFPGPEEFAGWVARTAADPASVAVAVTGRSGRALGVARFLRIDRAHGVVEVGGIVWGRSLQRTTAATEAVHLMAAHVLDDLGYRRLEWKCDSRNAGSRAAALRLGFRHEGVFRNHMVVKGRSRDTAWYAITAEEWATVSAAHRRWLDPANFDAAGAQREPLAARPHPGMRIPDAGTAGTLA
jgi:RimJ/RimL family protein N-acetyltransferase